MTEYIEIVKQLAQTGACGIIVIAVWCFLQDRKSDTKDRAEERLLWFSKIETLSNTVADALQELKNTAMMRCPLINTDPEILRALQDRFHGNNNNGGKQ